MLQGHTGFKLLLAGYWALQGNFSDVLLYPTASVSTRVVHAYVHQAALRALHHIIEQLDQAPLSNPGTLVRRKSFLEASTPSL
jgi:hypothetical protein